MTRVLPRGWRHSISRALGQVDRRAAIREARALAVGSAPILAGPWTGEVGFEVLYWIPFLRWLLDEAGIPRDRVVACSRGGVDMWYEDVAARYVDVFDFIDPAALKGGTMQRKAATGEQKQSTRSSLDEQLIGATRRAIGADLQVLHPSLMFRLYRRYFWKHAGPEWVQRMARFALWPAAASTPTLPSAYVAIKFYFNDCVVDQEKTRRCFRDIVSTVARSIPVVSLATGLRLDDHRDFDAEHVITPALNSPRTNLGQQAEILSRATAFIGTYGGYSYVPAFYGVPSAGIFTEPDAFARTHLAMAQAALARVNAPPLMVLAVSDALETIPAWLATVQTRA